MQISITTLVIIAVAVLVLVVLGLFFTSSTAPQIQSTDSQRIFAEKCDEFKSKDCDWSVTREAGFDSFMNACRQLYGSASEKVSCLYNYCQACKKVSGDPREAECFSLCEEAKANKAIGLSNALACGRIADECAGGCEAC